MWILVNFLICSFHEKPVYQRVSLEFDPLCLLGWSCFVISRKPPSCWNHFDVLTQNFQLMANGVRPTARVLFFLSLGWLCSVKVGSTCMEVSLLFGWSQVFCKWSSLNSYIHRMLWVQNKNSLEISDLFCVIITFLVPIASLMWCICLAVCCSHSWICKAATSQPYSSQVSSTASTHLLQCVSSKVVNTHQWVT